MPTSSILLSTMLVLTGPPPTTTQDTLRSASIQAAGLVSLVEEIKIPAKQTGYLVALNKREGDQVTAGTALAQINDDNARLANQIAELEQQLAEREALNNVRVEAALNLSQVAEKEFQIKEPLKNNGVLNRLEVERAQLQWEQSKLQVTLAKRQVEDAQLTLKIRGHESALAQRAFEERQVVSPLDGVVTDVYRREGEWVQQGEPILRVVQLQRLKVEAFIDSMELAPYEALGTTAIVKVRADRNQTLTVPACKVTYVSAELEPNGEYRIWIELENQRVKDRRGNEHWLLRPGMSAEVEIHIGAI